jgi:hypothetical protein
VELMFALCWWANEHCGSDRQKEVGMYQYIMRSDDVPFDFSGLDVVVCSLMRETSLESVRFGSGPRPDRRHV